MAMKTPRPARRTFTVSFPTQLADQVQRMAAEESRTTSELFREAFRVYRAERLLAQLAASHAEAQLAGSQYGPEDVDRLVHEVRSEMAAQTLGKAS